MQGLRKWPEREHVQPPRQQQRQQAPAAAEQAPEPRPEPRLVLAGQAELQPEVAPQAHYYPFRERLQRGVILRRHKRFTLQVLVDGQVLLCYCPTTFMGLAGGRLDGEKVCLHELAML